MDCLTSKATYFLSAADFWITIDAFLFKVRRNRREKRLAVREASVLLEGV